MVCRQTWEGHSFQGWGASRANYEAQLIAERLTGETTSGFTNAAMQWGIETEPEARAAYQFYADSEVEEVGFIDHPTIAMSGASPDGLVGVLASLDGLIEIKCPNTATHLATLLDSKVPAKYMTQMQWQMACTERAWCDWVSYDPRLPESMRLFVQRIERDDKRIQELEKERGSWIQTKGAPRLSPWSMPYP
jgi:putative phage-type endonuclease